MDVFVFRLLPTCLIAGPWGRGLVNHIAVVAPSARMSSPRVKTEKRHACMKSIPETYKGVQDGQEGELIPLTLG